MDLVKVLGLPEVNITFGDYWNPNITLRGTILRYSLKSNLNKAVEGIS